MVEAGLGHLPFTERSVVTPTGNPYVGVDFAKKLCGVSIIRSGESMENALRACCKGIKIGKILVHRCAAARRAVPVVRVRVRVSSKREQSPARQGPVTRGARLQAACAGTRHDCMRLAASSHSGVAPVDSLY